MEHYGGEVQLDGWMVHVWTISWHRYGAVALFSEIINQAMDVCSGKFSGNGHYYQVKGAVGREGEEGGLEVGKDRAEWKCLEY